MPHIAITMIPGRNHQQKKDLAQKVQDFLAAELNLEKQYVSVSIADIPVEHWQESMDKFPDNILYIKPGV